MMFRTATAAALAAAPSYRRAGACPVAGRIAAIVLLLLLHGAQAHAQERRDPLASLVADALRTNAALQAERHATDRTEAQIREARSLLLPALQFDARYSEQRGTLDVGALVNPVYSGLNQVLGEPRYPTDITLTLPLQHESKLRLTQPVVNVALWSNHAAARHRHAAQEWQASAAARRLAAEVQLAYWTAASAARAVEVYATTLELVRESERVSQRLVDAGRTTPDVVFRARADRSEVEQQLAEARERAAAARRSVNQLAGRELDAALDAVPSIDTAGATVVARAAAIAGALARREELAQLESGARAADAGARAAAASWLPSVAVAVDYGVQGREIRFDGASDYVIGSLVVSWNVFNGGGTDARRDNARGEAQRLRALRRDVEDRVRLDVLQAYDAAEVARGAIGTAEERVQAARRSYSLVRRRHEEGVVSQVELIDARSALTSAELNRSLTEYRYAMRLVELERAAALRDIEPGRR